ncbi:uncharacterized protein LOC118204390, partial [Stegodyphus dumicola]|uniref:uncharacterized protein LOC118204390 n=1 Tax=Stegodyphus dumicola TaxID=202533 RepID=UPI0015A7940F
LLRFIFILFRFLQIILITLIASIKAAPVSQSLSVHDDGSYRFYYETGKEGGSHSRTEVRNADGVVIGKFSYEDPTGEMREVNYRADDSGYVAKGDVSVEGAPKGQFPVIIDDKQQEIATTAPLVQEDQTQPPETPAPEPAAESANEEEHDKDDIKDYSFEEQVGDQPEAFPEGYFLEHKFQGLRRLPEPTKEDKSSSVEPPEEKQTPPPEEKEPEKPVETSIEIAKREMELFMHLRPFPNFPPKKWDPSMLHQPVYVFAYQQPDAYGYHYYF